MKFDMEVVTATYQKELNELHALGFPKKMKNAKLLHATKGDVEIVKNFLKAKEALQLKKKQVKTDMRLLMKPEKRQRKIEKGDRKMIKEEKKEAKRKEKEMRKLKKPERTENRTRTGSNENSNEMVAEQTPPHTPIPAPQSPPFVSDRFHSLTENSWPTGAARLYLDGNNMLFVLAPIRSLVLKRNAKAAEAALEALARRLASALNLEHCTLIFDDTRRTTADDGFTVCSARPAFRTSDDALVQMAQETEIPSVYVTSDRELLQRLEAAGNHVVLCKPKEWFLFAARTLSRADVRVDQLDEWMTEWMKKNVEDDMVQDIQKKLNL